MRQKVNLLVILLFIAGNLIWAQGSNPSMEARRVTPPSPNAAALGKFGDWPVDLSNGLVNIDIPVYTIKSRSLELPISLSYHASGIRVDQRPGSVGLGWALNAGGVLNRTIRGRRDESGHLSQSYYTTNQLHQMTDGAAIENFLNPRARGTIDNESDFYSYYAHGISGKFQYTTGHQLFQIPLSDNKIIDNPGVSYTIISDKGVTYHFAEIETSNNQASGAGDEPTSFHLSQMISADKTDTIFFEYGLGPGYGTQVSISHMITAPYTGNATLHPISMGVVTHSVKALRKIRFANGYITFVPSTSVSAFSEIKVYDNANNLKQSVQMQYSTWASRLMLDKVKLFAGNGLQVGEYVLTYNTTYTLPNYYSASGSNNEYFGQDLWGYYNGVTTNTTLQTVGPTSVPINTNRSVSEQHAQAGILKEIKFPTGGFSRFFYESNNSGMPVGGLRIKRIETYERGDAAPVVKNYTYGVGYSAGNLSYLNATQNYQYTQEERVFCTSCPPGYIDGTVILKEIYLSNSSMPFSFNSNTAFYSEVTETLTANGIPLGKTEYRFEAEQDSAYATNVNPVSNAGNITPRYHTQVVDLGWSRGPLKTKKVYRREANGNFTLIRLDSMVYANYRSANYTTGINVFSHVVFPFNMEVGSTQYPNNVRAKYQYFDIVTRSYAKKLVETITKDYSNGTELVVSTANVYGAANAGTKPHFQVTQSQTTSSKNQTIKNVYQYPSDFSGTAVYDSMWQRNMKSVVVKQVEKVNDVDSKGTFTHYGIKSGGTAPAYAMFLPEKVQSFNKGVGFEDALYFDAYDERANLKQQHRAANLNTSYYWGYNKAFPIAEAVNAAANEIFFSGFEERGWEGIIGPQFADKPVSAYDATFSRSGRVAARIDKPTSGEQYSHSDTKLNINLTASTKFKLSGWVYSNGPSADIYLFMYRNGETSYFSQVDYVNTTTVGKWVYLEKEITVPADMKQLNVRIDNNGGGSVWFDDIRLHPAAARMTTYTYDPLIGITSQTDINNRTTHYQYDTYGRLSLVLDHDRNILKKYCYSYQGQTENCVIYYNEDKSGTYYRNCGSGQIALPYYVSVPAGMFSAPTLQEANNLALQYAQNQANLYGTCQSTSLTLYAYNYTSDNFTITLYNLQTSQAYYFNIGNSYSSTLGQVPAGYYNVSISNPNNWNYYYYNFYAFGYYGWGMTGTFSNVYINGSNNYIQITN